MSLAFLQSASSTADATSYTFSNQNVGSAAADRYIIVGVYSRKAGEAGADPTVTVEGVSANLAVTRWTTVTNSNFAGLYIAALPSGTDADVVVDFGASTMVRAAISLWRVDSLSSATASDTAASGANDPTGTIDVPVDGFAVGVAMTLSNATPVSWTGITEADEFTVEAQITCSAAGDEFASGSSGLVITADFGTSNASAGAFASWEFGAAPPATGRVMFPPNLSGTGRGGVFPGNRLAMRA